MIPRGCVVLLQPQLIAGLAEGLKIGDHIASASSERQNVIDHEHGWVAAAYLGVCDEGFTAIPSIWDAESASATAVAQQPR